VDYLIGMYIWLKRFKTSSISSTSCMNSRNLIRRITSVLQMVHTLHLRGYRYSDKVFYSNEAWFHISGYINSQNNRICSIENLHTFHERLLHSLKVRVWCAVSQERINGPIFFSETITAECYQEFIMHFTSLLEVDEQDCWLQQDGSMAHITK
jgi:hypothetical protein